ncbi:MAG: DUF5105 domain-containing protein [Halanaerobiales bacterium]
MKKHLIATVLVAVLILMVGCSPEVSPEDTVREALEELKNNNIEEFKKYILDSDDFDDEEIDDSLKLLVKNLEIEINGSSIDGDSATVNANITNTNFTIVMEEFLTKAMSLAMENAFSEEPISEDEMEAMAEEMLFEILERNDIETVTTEADISLEKENGDWKIEYDEEIQNALFFGISDFEG